MSPLVNVLFFFLMFADAVVFSMLGQGGGVLYTPIQLFFGVDFHCAAKTSLVLILVTSLSSTLVFRKAHKVDWLMAPALELPSMAGAFAGGLLSSMISDRILSLIFSAVIIAASVFLVRDYKGNPKCDEGPSTLFSWKRKVGDLRYCINLPLAAPIAILAGLISGMMGIAGGLIKVPMMVLLFGVPMEVAVGSSSLMVGLTALGGLAGHITAGHEHCSGILLLLPLIFVGGQIGARISLSIDRKKLKKGFGWFLFAVAAAMLLRVYYTG